MTSIGLEFFLNFSDAFFSRIADWFRVGLHLQQRHPKRVVTAIAGLMLVGGSASYAVATLGPDAARLPTHQLVQPLDLSQGLQSLAAAPLGEMRLYRSAQTRRSDSAESLLSRLGIQDHDTARFIRQSHLARMHLLGKAGRQVRAEVDRLNRPTEISARWVSEDSSDVFQRLVLRRTDSGWNIDIQTGTLSATTQLASGIIASSLFAATDQARIPDSVAMQMADIFSGDIDFHRSLRKGDRFSVAYETLEADGEPMRVGRIISAEFENNRKTHTAIWFQEPGSAKGEYYSLNGESLRRAYLASPVAFTRISSVMGMRFHPVHQTMKAHNGVDYAAPTGTMVRSVADGVVQKAGIQGGYGQVIEISHRNGHSTLYAHLSKIDVKKGQPIQQGQRIGAVGATGTATGPHLHFEFRISGVHRDPLTLAKQSESRPVTAQARGLFDRYAQQAQLDLVAAASVLPSSTQ